MTRPKFCEALGLCHICYFSTTRRNAGVGLSSLVTKIYNIRPYSASYFPTRTVKGLPLCGALLHIWHLRRVRVGLNKKPLYNNRFFVSRSGLSENLTMVDTVKLFSPDFSIKSLKGWTLADLKDGETGEVIGEKMYCNLPSGSGLDVKRQGERSALFYDVHSLPGLVLGSSLHELHEEDWERSLSAMGEELEAAHVDFDKEALGEWRLSRLDVCRNLQTSRHSAEYIVLLELGVLPYMRTNHTHGETALWLNGGEQFTAYNKVKAVKDKGQALLAGVTSQTPENILRLEARFNHARTVSAKTGCKTLREAWSEDNTRRVLLERFDTLAATIEQPSNLTLSNDLERLLELKRHSRYFFNQFIYADGVRSFLRRYNYDFELIKQLLSPVCSRSQLFSILKRLGGAIAEHTSPEWVDLLGEVRLKLAA